MRIIVSMASPVVPISVNFPNIGGAFICRFYLRFWITCVCLVAEKPLENDIKSK